MELNVLVPHHLKAVTLMEGTYYILAIKIRPGGGGGGGMGGQGVNFVVDFDLRNPKNYIENQNLKRSKKI